MAIKASGSLSFSEIVAEFADTTPYSLSEFYRNGGKVTSNNLGVPTAGLIRFGNFYGATNEIALTIASNVSDLNLRTWALANGWDGAAPLRVTINSGVWVSGSVAGNSTAALTIDGSFPAGVTLINNGTIAGRGGAGGTGQAGAGSPAATAGQAGGRALLASSPVSITNNGTVAGGGGGGGGGSRITVISTNFSGGGGGGGRSNVSFTGAAGAFGAGNVGTGSVSATAGTSSAAGTGGRNTNNELTRGGSGGGWGSAGATGSGSGGVAGGAAGQAVSGNSNITWLATGTRLGPIV